MAKKQTSKPAETPETKPDETPTPDAAPDAVASGSADPAEAPPASASGGPPAPATTPQEPPAAPKAAPVVDVPKAPRGMKYVSLVPPVHFPAINLLVGDGVETITPEPRLVTVAVANALAKAAQPGAGFGLTPEKIQITDEQPPRPARRFRG